MSENENMLLKNKHLLICHGEELVNLNEIYSKEFDYIKKNFCGIVLSIEDLNNKNNISDVILYLCGDIGQIYDTINENVKHNRICIVKELSYNYTSLFENENYLFIEIGQVPINIHNVGIYFRKLFCGESNKNYFNLINREHNFQMLTQSNKPDKAFRKGIYLSKVEDYDGETKFNLLRCSTNLNGPTDNFRDSDNFIIEQVNNISKYFFSEEVKLNHVLAQIYENNIVKKGTKIIEKKATIKSHSDKTKDMPRNGLIAFCTFYKQDLNNYEKNVKKSMENLYDYTFNGKQSVLTKIHFKVKDIVKDPSLVKEFSLPLYPNSVFIIPLSTNRLYVHSINPSVLPIDKIPTRMGYVIRCSKTKAIYKNGQTYIEEKENGNYTKLEKMTSEDEHKLIHLYYQENTTDKIINYDNIYFSMNDGDYKQPII